jgi:hypothetical protein
MAVYALLCLRLTAPALDEKPGQSRKAGEADHGTQEKRENRFPAAIRAIGFVGILIVLALAVVGGWLSPTLAISGLTRSKNPQVALMVTLSEATRLPTAPISYFCQYNKPARRDCKAGAQRP